MGEIVLAPKCTYGSAMPMSEQDGPVKGTLQSVVYGDLGAARRGNKLSADTILLCETVWATNAGFPIYANSRFEGLLTSDEFSQFIQNMSYAHDTKCEVATGYSSSSGTGQTNVFFPVH